MYVFQKLHVFFQLIDIGRFLILSVKSLFSIIFYNTPSNDSSSCCCSSPIVFLESMWFKTSLTSFELHLLDFSGLAPHLYMTSRSTLVQCPLSYWCAQVYHLTCI